MRFDAAEREPRPTGEGRPIVPLVVRDLTERQKAGILKYGTQLRAHNGRRALVDLYQELLDAVCYLRQVLEEEE
jgi:hypothetical protein